MGKKAWITSPVVILASAAMFLMAFLSLRYDRNLFLLELFLSILFLLFSSVKYIWFKGYINKMARTELSNISLEEKSAIDNLPFPIAIIGKFNDVVYFNQLFKEEVCHGEECFGNKINAFIMGKSVDDILKCRGVDVSFKDKSYTVFGFSGKDSKTLCFFDDTYYKKIAKEYVESRPVVVFAVLDNKDEILSNAEEGESAQLVIKFEQALQNWVSSTSGFFKRIRSNRYMLVFEERNLRIFEKEKFKVLEEVRKIKLNDRIFATASIGIGKSGRTLKESEIWAQKALEMALGRGGDQVAIKDKEGYSFFGGISKGAQRSGQVRTRIIANAISEQIMSSDNILIMGHSHSDLDSIGAAIGVWSAAYRGFKKPTYIVVNQETTLARPLIKKFCNEANLNIFISDQDSQDLISDNTLLILVDTHLRGFLDYPKIYDLCKKTVVIDHHRLMVNHIENSVVFFHDPSASSACEMVAELVQYLSEPSLMRIEAEALLSGIMLDTKNFVLKTGTKTFEAAAFLKKKGADSISAKKMFSNSIGVYKERYGLISGAEIFSKFAISCTKKSSPSLRISAAQAADELLEVEGVEASFVIYQENDFVNVSARSFGNVNVQLIMENIGGGGHQSMAGAQIEGKTVEQVKSIVMDILKDLTK